MEETDGPIANGSRVGGANDCGRGVAKHESLEVPEERKGHKGNSPNHRAAELANGGASSEESNNEVDEFYTLLDSTLHLPEPSSREGEGDDPPQPRVAFDGEEAALPSGRLADRIAMLRR